MDASGRLNGEVIVVTGSTYGLGRAMAVQFAAEGAQVIVSGRSRERGLETVREAVAAGGAAAYVPLDVVDEASVRAAVDEAVNHFGRITGLVNNAAMVASRGKSDGPITELTLDEWEALIRVNLTGTFLATKYFLTEIVRARAGGAVLNIASTAAIRGRGGRDAYTAAKGAIVSLTRSMAHHYFVRHQVRVNCLAVGTIDTGEAWVREQLADPEYGPALLNYYLGRLGRPEHVAAMAAHLMSHEAEFINGAVIPVDGGATAVANWRP